MLKLEPQHGGVNALWHMFVDPWLAMLCIGALGHQLSLPFLLTLGYWNVWLVVFIIECISPLISQYHKITWGE